GRPRHRSDQLREKRDEKVRTHTGGRPDLPVPQTRETQEPWRRERQSIADVIPAEGRRETCRLRQARQAPGIASCADFGGQPVVEGERLGCRFVVPRCRDRIPKRPGEVSAEDLRTRIPGDVFAAGLEPTLAG